MTWDDADWQRQCREADARARKQKPDPKLARLRRLLEDSISIERAWAEINGNKERDRMREKNETPERRNIRLWVRSRNIAYAKSRQAA
jgi:head-tail adaptor